LFISFDIQSVLIEATTIAFESLLMAATG